MLILNIINFFRGYVKIRISGKHTERFINICAKKNIYIWNIKRIKQDILTAYISMTAFDMLEDIAISSETEIEEIKRGGIKVFIKKVLRRSGLLIGFIIATALFLWMTSRVWYIEVAESGISEAVLMEQIRKAGIDIGVKTSSIDTVKFQAQMMNINPQIEWIWAEKSGTKIYIDLREKVKKPTPIDINKPCNLIATHAGEVTFSMITEGRAMVSVGNHVSEGQLLAGGILDSSVVGARGVHSQGTVMADVMIRKYGDYLLTKEVEVPTGRVKKSYTLVFGKNEINLPSKKTEFVNKTTETTKIPVKIGDIYFPLSIIKKTEQETITKTVKLSREEVVLWAEKYLDGLLQKEIGSGTIIERYFFNEDIDENTVRVRLEAMCNMQIAKEQPIEGD